MKHRAIAAIALGLLVPAARAATCTSVTLPDSAEVDGKKLVLNGLGLREATMLKVDVYVAGLYLEAKSADGAAIAASDGTKKLVLHFVRDVTAKQMTGAWTEGFEKNAKDLQPLQERIDKLNAAMTDMAIGDEMVFTYRPETGVEVMVKGKVAATIAGKDFAQPFFSIWLGPTPPNEGLKVGLLGGVCK